MAKRLEVALIVLHNSRGRFLLQHRSNDAGLLPGYWAFFGGRIEKGELVQAAVRREACEELNYRLKDPRLIQERNFREGKTFGRLYVFVERYSRHKSAIKLREGQGLGWYNKEEIKDLKMVNRDRKIIDFVVKYLKRRKEHEI